MKANKRERSKTKTSRGIIGGELCAVFFFFLLNKLREIVN